MPTLTRRSLLSLHFALLATIVLTAGCAQKENDSTATAAAPTASAAPAAVETLQVGLITPGKVTDKGWCESAYDAVEKIANDLSAKADPPIEEPAKAEVAGAIRTLAQNGDNLIFLHASEYDEDAAAVAPDFPKTTFVVVGGRTEKPNLTPIQFSAGEATYLAGMVAGGMTKTNKIACVGGVEIPIVKDSFQSFEKGAKSVNPNVQVKITFTGDGSDIAKAKQQTQALLDAGVDVVMHNANAGGQGVAQAVMDKDGALFIGANADQSDLATPKNLGSFIVDVPNAYLAVAKAVQQGKSGGAFPLGLKDRAVYFQFNDQFAGTVPADLKAKMETAEKDLIGGKIQP